MRHRVLARYFGASKVGVGGASGGERVVQLLSELVIMSKENEEPVGARLMVSRSGGRWDVWTMQRHISSHRGDGRR